MLYSGEDKALAVVIQDSEGVVLSIDDMSDLIIFLYQRSDDTILVKYRKAVTPGYTTLIRVSATEYTAILPKAITDIIPETELMMEGMMLEEDERFENNLRRTKGKGIVTNVEKSLIDE